MQIITDAAVIYLPLADIIDTDKERKRLNTELEKLRADAERLNKKLSNESFVSKAPAAVVDGERAKLAKALESIAGVEAALKKLG